MTLGLKKVHLAGIGGSGMSGIAKMLLAMKVEVTGCDTRASSVTEELSEQGASIHRGHGVWHLDAGTSALVHSAAVKADNPEIREAVRLNIPVLKYAQMLGRLLADKTGIAVSGTHGKTTTSAMIAYCMEGAKLQPSFVIGSPIAGLGRNSQVGEGPYFVVEACEYDRSFLNLQPHIAVTTNVEEDHLDYYRDLREIIGAFGDFARLIEGRGLYVVNGENAGALAASREAKARVETFGIGVAAHWEASNLQLIQGCYAFDVAHEGRPFGDFQLRIAGRHNVANALAAIAVLHKVGLSSEEIAEQLLAFSGTSRRFEHLGRVGEIELVDDYAHHPTEVRATLAAARDRFGQRRLIVVFQPHQYSRTRFLFSDFVSSFDAADVLVVPDIYFVRDSEFERSQVNSHDLVMEIAKRGVRALYIPTFEEIERHLAKILEPNDVLITMGAGNVNEISRRMRERLLAAVR